MGKLAKKYYKRQEEGAVFFVVGSVINIVINISEALTVLVI